MFDYVVVGKGLVGSAAVRYLSETGESVAIIGPDEPDNWQTHEGVFASHYDQGRITRILDVDWVWAVLAKRSIAQYAAIEQQSGLKFHYDVSGLKIDHNPEKSDSYLAKTERVGRQLNVDFTIYTGDLLKEAYPWFNFSPGALGLLENRPAGYIHPRTLIAAQLEAARRQGVSIIRDQVVSIQKTSEAVAVVCAQGQTYRTRKVLLAAGAYTNTLLEQELDLTPLARTILLAELSEREAARFKDMPTLICELPDAAPLSSIYMLPPIQYPDGRYYLKMGGGDDPTDALRSPADLRAWFHTNGRQTVAEAQKETLLSLIPGLEAISFQTKPCVTTHTGSGYPYLDALALGQIFVAAGGCGYAAKSSNEIGRLAAQLVVNEAWRDELDEELFKANVRREE